jgi:hypothetical protein
MIKMVTLEIESWMGVSIGAIHFYGTLHFDDTDGEYQRIEIRRVLDEDAAYKLTKQKNSGKNPDYWVDYEEGQDTECFDGSGDIKRIAIDTWKEHCPDGELLICGRFAVGDPQEVIAADDPEVMKLINEMCDHAELIGGYEGDFDTMRKISDLYCKLIEGDC